jgi:hypothetical protein
VYGTASSTEGTGVYGTAPSATGTTYGVHGKTSSSSGCGIYGEAPKCGVFGETDATSGEAYGVHGTTLSPGGYGVYGEAPVIGVLGETSATSGATYGVRGENSTSSGAGVYGVGDPCGVRGSATTGAGERYGVHGSSSGSEGRGVYGEAYAFGVYGKASSNSSNSYGVYGTTESNYGGSSVHGEATGTAGLNFGVYGTSPSIYARAVEGSATATSGTTFGVFGITASPDGYGVYYSGGFGGVGPMRSIVRTTRGPTGLDVMTAAGNWVEDFGEARLSDGKAHVDLDPLFLETVSVDATHPMHVFVQLHDPGCRGVAVARGTTGFEVIELDKGRSGGTFSYRVVAKRKGFESARLEACPAGFADPFLYPELKGVTEIERVRQMCVRSGHGDLFDRLAAQAEKHDAESETRLTGARRDRPAAGSSPESGDTRAEHDLESREEAIRALTRHIGEPAE